MNRHKKNFATIFTVVFFYVIASATLYDTQSSNNPAVFQYFTEYFTLLYRYMFRPLYPLLQPFGLVTSDAAELPTPWGIVAGSFVYMVLLWMLAWVFSSKPPKRRPFEEPWQG